MNRTVTAALCLAGIAIPALIASIFFFGCCVLPFHHALHEALPLCQMLAAGDHHDSDADHHPATPPAPSHAQKQFLVQASLLMPSDSGTRSDNHATLQQLSATRASVRNVITMGAVRCDDDVGLQLLHATFLI